MVVFPSSTDSSQSVVNGTTLSTTTAGLLSVFTIRAKDAYANSKTAWDNSFMAFVSLGNKIKKTHAAISANVEPGSFRVSYTVTRAGTSSISIASAATGGIAATYYTSFNSSGFEQSAAVAGVESVMDISWNGSALAYLPKYVGTVRWRGLIRPTATTPYTFVTLQDVKNASIPSDRVQLWLDGQLLLDQWTSLDFTPAAVSVSFPMAYEFYELEMLYQSQAFTRLRLPVIRLAGNAPSAIPSSNLFISQPVADSPYSIQVLPALTDLASSVLAGSYLTLSTAGAAASFSLISLDRFGNRRNTSGDTYLLHAVSSAYAQVLDSSSVYVGNGIYSFSYVATLQDSYQVQVVVMICQPENFKLFF